ncbi:50S ribosomal protein L32, partial [bacterium]|nr:50S ribosomal protein L32 [bacterium]
MAVPKRRTSKARGRKRRTHKKASTPTVSSCPSCGEPKLP